MQFKSNVNLTTDKIKLHTDVLDYDMRTHIATIEDETEILSLEDGNKIYTSSGTYNLATGQGTLYNRSTVKGRDGNTIVGDAMMCTMTVVVVKVMLREMWLSLTTRTSKPCVATTFITIGIKERAMLKVMW